MVLESINRSSKYPTGHYKMTNMIPDCSCVLCVRIVIVFVLAGQSIIRSPAVKGSAVVLAVDMD